MRGALYLLPLTLNSENSLQGSVVNSVGDLDITRGNGGVIN